MRYLFPILLLLGLLALPVLAEHGPTFDFVITTNTSQLVMGHNTSVHFQARAHGIGNSSQTNLSTVGLSTPSGIFWNESHWFVCDYSNDHIYVFNASWDNETALGRSLATNLTGCLGMATNGSSFYVVDEGSAQIHTFTSFDAYHSNFSANFNLFFDGSAGGDLCYNGSGGLFYETNEVDAIFAVGNASQGQLYNNTDYSITTSLGLYGGGDDIRGMGCYGNDIWWWDTVLETFTHVNNTGFNFSDGEKPTHPQGRGAFFFYYNGSHITGTDPDNDSILQFNLSQMVGAVLQTNESGAYANVSGSDISLLGRSNNSNITFSNLVSCWPGFGLRILANDTEGIYNNSNETSIQTIPWLFSETLEFVNLTSMGCVNSTHALLNFTGSGITNLTMYMNFVDENTTFDSCSYNTTRTSKLRLQNESDFCNLTIETTTIGTQQSLEIGPHVSLFRAAPPNLPAAIGALSVLSIIVIYNVVIKRRLG